MLAVIWLVAHQKTFLEVPAKLYIYTGLLVNTSLFLGMYYDINYTYTGEWWFWDFYTITVNLMDMMMLIALFCNKDFLGLVKLYRSMRGQTKLA